MFIDSTKLEEGDLSELDQVDAILVPGGFGVRGTEGKILAVRYAREKKVPFFGICLGLQMAVIEFGRDVLGLDGANSLEFDEKTPHPVVTLMEAPEGASPTKGGTMRLGSYPCALKDGTKARELYGADLIQERHRHRFEFNNAYRGAVRAGGHGLLRREPGPEPRRDDRAEQPPALRGLPVPPRVQVEALRGRTRSSPASSQAAREHRDQARRGTGAAVTKLPVGKSG